MFIDILDNLLFLTDGYKYSHGPQYPRKTSIVRSYLEPRKGGEFKEVVFAGLQYHIKQYLEGVVVTREKIEEAALMCEQYLGNPKIFNRAGFEYILEKHGGRLPILLRAVPEGTVVPEGNVLMTAENTDPNCWWLTNFLETLLSHVWYTCTIATVSREMKKIVRSALVRSGDDEKLELNLLFKVHDFGCRGVSCMEQAAIGGAMHLFNFLGTDTVPALRLLQKFYNAKEMPGFSIPAAEHSTITSWGKENEAAAYENMLDTYPEGLVAVVSDSYDIYNACKIIWGRQLKDKVMKRNGTLVIRPDSGDPKKVLPELLNILGNEFGYITNDKGYKVLPDKVRLIQGDGIDRNSLKGILDAVMEAGWSADNVAFGSGGGLLQQVNRDTSKYAFKCSQIVVDGEERDVFKSPVDAPWKASKKGRLALVKHPMFKAVHGSEWATINQCGEDFFAADQNQLREVFRDGKLLIDDNLDAIRERARI